MDGLLILAVFSFVFLAGGFHFIRQNKRLINSKKENDSHIPIPFWETGSRWLGYLLIFLGAFFLVFLVAGLVGVFCWG